MSQPLSQKLMRCARKAAPACLTVWALALAACGGSDGTSPPDPLQPYRAQVVQWTECDPGILGQPSDAMNALRGSQRLRCALVRAPLDWGNPAHGDITLAVMRLAAGKPEARRGALLFNPGGPGVDGLNLTFRLWDAFAGSSPADAQGARQLRLLDEYDMVGFSPRGVGASTQLQCGTNEPSRFVDYSVTGWDTPGNLANVHYNGRKTAEACQKNPLTPHISTEAMARDMDLLRSLLGDDKLNYVGYSYGSWLGAWYAGLFPDKVGRMVLDSVMDFGVTMEQALLHAQPPARQRLFDEVLAPYAARHADYFRLGTSAAEVRAAVQALSPSVQAVLGEALSGLSYFRVDANGYLERITVAQGLDAVRQQVPGLDDPDAVKAALARHVFDPAIPARDAFLRQLAWQQFYPAYVSTWLAPPQRIALDSRAAAGAAVRCNDTPAITDLAQWTATVRGLADKAPWYFGGLLANHACAFWQRPSVAKPSLQTLQPLDVLFVQSQYDGATPSDGANAFFTQLPRARRVSVPGDYQHGVYPYTDTCVDPLVTSYLLGEPPAQRDTVCPAHALERDALLQAQSKSSSAPTAYLDPQKARALIDAFKRGLQGDGRGW